MNHQLNHREVWKNIPAATHNVASGAQAWQPIHEEGWDMVGLYFLEGARILLELVWLYLERARLSLHRIWLDVQIWYLDRRIQHIERAP